MVWQCRVNNKIIRNKDEARKLCGAQPREKERVCQLSRPNCKVRYDWKIRSPWSECSVSCGTEGIESRDVVCWDVSDASNLKTLITFDNQLKHHMATDEDRCMGLTQKPYETRPCEKPKCPPTWRVSDWHECEPSMGKCGTGFNYREVECTRGSHVITDQFCDST